MNYFSGVTLIKFTCLASCLLECSCTHDYSPPWPSQVSTEYPMRPDVCDYGSEATISIAGLELTADGVYVDLYCCSTLDSDHAMVYWGGIGRSLSLLNSPSHFIEIRSHSDETIDLKPMKEPSRPHLFAEVYWKRPPNYVLQRDNEGTVVIQRCIWRTADNLGPGSYLARLKDWPFEELNPRLRQNWKTFDVEQSTRATN